MSKLNTDPSEIMKLVEKAFSFLKNHKDVSEDMYERVKKKWTEIRQRVGFDSIPWCPTIGVYEYGCVLFSWTDEVSGYYLECEFEPDNLTAYFCDLESSESDNSWYADTDCDSPEELDKFYDKLKPFIVKIEQ